MAPSIGRIQKRKTNPLQIIIFDLQCAAGPYRRAIKRLMHRSKEGSLFDHLIGAAEQRDWEGEAECLGGLEVDDELHSYRSLDR
jgi:hypothetical protein